MVEKRLGVAIIGCGHIAKRYASSLTSFPSVALVGVTDLAQERARDLAAEYHCRAYSSVEALLDDEAVGLVANLTTHHAHQAVTARCLEAGKHVHSEKPLALTTEGAQALVDLARERGLRLGCSPFTFMGEAQQTLWKCVRDNWLGPVRVAYAEANWGRIEAWHPAPIPFYEVGVLFDVAVYPLTLLTSIFGPARSVWAHGRVLEPDRVTVDGTPFRIQTPDFIVALIELRDGLLVRLTATFYVGRQTKQRRGSLELHGDRGSLYLSDWHDFDGLLEFASYGEPYAPVPPLREPYRGVEWGRAVADMADALVQGRPHRASGEQAAHVVEIVCAAATSMERGQPVAVHSSFAPPAPMDWAG